MHVALTVRVFLATFVVALGVVAAVAASLVPHLGYERHGQPAPKAAPEPRSLPARATG